PEKIGEIGDGKLYQRVQVSFSRPTAAKPPKGGTTVEPARGGGSSTTKPSTRAAAAGMLLIMGASILLDWLDNRENEKRIREEAQRKEKELLKEQAAEPQLGFLLLFRFKRGAEGMDGNTSAPSFQGLGWRRGYTESETKENWAAESRMGNADDEY